MTSMLEQNFEQSSLAMGRMRAPEDLEGRLSSGSPGVELVVYTRYEHGNLPVRVYQDAETGATQYEVSGGLGTGKRVYTSARQMISEFYGHDVHMPFDRYFRLGRYRLQSNTGGANLLQLLDQKNPSGSRILVNASAKNTKKPLQTTKIAVAAAENTQKSSATSKFEFSELRNTKQSSVTSLFEVTELKNTKRDSENSKNEVYEEFFSALSEELGTGEQSSGGGGGDAVELCERVWTPEIGRELERSLELELDRLEERVGIDLVARGHEIRKLLFAGFAGKMLSRGYDPEDVMQEIYRGLVVRNRGKCPWDKRKSSFGHYVHMAINCILTNYHRKANKRVDRDALPLEITGPDGQELDTVSVLGSSVGSVQIYAGSELGDQMALLALREYLAGLPDRGPEAELGREILPWVTAGCSRREIVQETGYKESLVSRALAWVRHQTALWATEMGMGRGVPLKYRLGHV